MSDIRWYLARLDIGTSLVVERRSDGLGKCIPVPFPYVDRHFARDALHTLIPIVRAIIVDPPLPARTFDPVEVEP